jgi:tetratricopeptide (TPR) repeat protein
MRIGLLILAVAGLLARPVLAATMQDLADCRVIGDDDAQIAACTRVIEDKASPDDERAMSRFNRGVAYETKGAYNEALADFDELLRGHPIGLVYANRGLVYQRLGDFRL